MCLDAAKFAATAPLDLAAVAADFAAVSFYKICGHPTGLGALLVDGRAPARGAAALARGKRYFGGGTVAAAVAGRPSQEKKITENKFFGAKRQRARWFI